MKPNDDIRKARTDLCPNQKAPEVCTTKEGRVGIFIGGAYRILTVETARAYIRALVEAIELAEARATK